MYSSFVKSIRTRVCGPLISATRRSCNSGAVVLSTRPTPCRTVTPSTASSSHFIRILLCSRLQALLEDEPVMAAHPAIADFVHQLAHEVNADAADLALS